MEKAKAFIKELKRSTLLGEYDPTSCNNNKPPVDAQSYGCTSQEEEPKKQHACDSLKLCYVCGSPAGSLEAVRVRVNADNLGEAYFPFLEGHAAPAGLPQIAVTQTHVLACLLCARSLHCQWEAYNREKKPLIQRIYHLKRTDGKGYLGAELHTQGEYASQLLGLSAEHLTQSSLNCAEPKTAVDQLHGNDSYAAAATDDQSRNATRESTMHSPAATMQLLEERRSPQQALNLCNAAALGYQMPAESAGATKPAPQVGILDLSMPDKNSTTEVCYVCGEEQRRGSLNEVRTVKGKDVKERNCPYFPLFNEQHPRPPRSRPKDPQGRIQACQNCHQHLLQQWQKYQDTNAPEKDRLYTLLRARATPQSACYTCGGELPAAQLCLVYCCANAQRKPYYPFLRAMQRPPHASPINAQGLAQICSPCYKKYAHLAEVDATQAQANHTSPCHNGGQHEGDAAPLANAAQSQSKVSSNEREQIRFKPYEQSVQAKYTGARQDSRPSSHSPHTQVAGPQASPNAALAQADAAGHYACYICKTLCQPNELEWLSTSAEYMVNSHAMHFPCLSSQLNGNSADSGITATSTSGSGSTAGSEQHSNRVLACKRCVNYLAHQWETMDAERVPLEHRRYNIPHTSSSGGAGDYRLNNSNAGSLHATSASPGAASAHTASTSIYCFLCGLHSDLILARVLYASKEGSRPYFPHLLTHKSPSNAEQLRSDFSALVCTFCYHSLLKQWHRYEEQQPSISPRERKYNWHDYNCHLCAITTYRKRVRALPVNEFPFVKNRRNDDGLLLENGEYAVVCLDCYESLRQQSFQHDRFGVPISRRAYNWVPQPPPPEDSPDVAVARLPCGGRADGKTQNSNVRQSAGKLKQSSSSSNNNTNTPKQLEKAKEAPPKNAATAKQRPSPAQQVTGAMEESSPSAAQLNVSQSFFTAALRNLAKQADVVTETAEQPASNKRPALSQPATTQEEKMPKYSSAHTIAPQQPEPHAGFQPYKTAERLLQPTASPLGNPYAASFLNMPNFGQTKFLNSPYAEHFYFNPRAHLPPRMTLGAHPLYAPMMPAYAAAHLYGLPTGVHFPLDHAALHELKPKEHQLRQQEAAAAEEHRAQQMHKAEQRREREAERYGVGVRPSAVDRGPPPPHLSLPPYHHHPSANALDSQFAALANHHHSGTPPFAAHLSHAAAGLGLTPAHFSPYHRTSSGLPSPYQTTAPPLPLVTGGLGNSYERSKMSPLPPPPPATHAASTAVAQHNIPGVRSSNYHAHAYHADQQQASPAGSKSVVDLAQSPGGVRGSPAMAESGNGLALKRDLNGGPTTHGGARHKADAAASEQQHERTTYGDSTADNTIAAERSPRE